MSAVILMGPIGVGKTTVGRFLAEKLDLPFCSLDELRPSYYQQIGYDSSAASTAQSAEGIRGLLRYAAPFDAQMIALALADYGQAVFDFGASNSVYEDPHLLAQVEALLAPYPHVILLLPTADPEESAAFLQGRLTRMLTAAGQPFTDELFTLNAHFINHPSNRRLAKRIIYTKDQTPEMIAAAIHQPVTRFGKSPPRL